MREALCCAEDRSACVEIAICLRSPERRLLNVSKVRTGEENHEMCV